MDMHINMQADTTTTKPRLAGPSPSDVSQRDHRPSTALAATYGVEKAAARRRKQTMIVTLFIAAGLVAALSMTANGQGAKFKSMQMHPKFLEPTTVRQLETAAKDLARAKDISSVRNPRFAQIYYLNYLPAKITQPDALPEISKLSQEVMKNLASAQRSNNPGAAQIVQFLFQGMKQVAEGDYHPAARITALSMIGRLDSRPGSTTAKRAPVPLAQSFPFMLAQYVNESNPDGVRAAALQGLHRYVSIGFPTLRPQDTAPVIAAMQKLLDSDPPAGRDRMAHAYLQRFAVDILATLQPTEASLADKLVSVSTERTRPDMIALYSVTKLAGLGNYGSAAENPQPLIDQWTVRAMRAFQYEHERLEQLDGIGQASSQPPKPETTVTEKKEQPRFTPNSYGDEYEDEEMDEEDDFGGDDGGYESEEMDDEYEEDDDGGFYVAAANPQPPEVLASRRRLNHVLQQIHRGVTGSTKAGVPSRPAGLLAIAKDENKTKIERWAKDMEELVIALNDPLNDDRSKFQDALVEQIEMIKEIAGSAGEEAAQEYEDLPYGMNPYAKLAVLSGVPLVEPKEPEPVIPIDVPPAAPDAAEPDADALPAAQPPLGAAASTPAPAPTGS